ncbi:hypothetical protein Tco_0276644 [Tanacetum coccineum]
MANFSRIEALVVATNSKGLFEGMLVYCDQENAKDLDFANGLHNLWVELLERTNERQLFISESKGLCPSAKRTNIVLPAGITFDLPALTITLSLPVGTTYLPAGTFTLPIFLGKLQRIEQQHLEIKSEI